MGKPSDFEYIATIYFDDGDKIVTGRSIRDIASKVRIATSTVQYILKGQNSYTLKRMNIERRLRDKSATLANETVEDSKLNY